MNLGIGMPNPLPLFMLNDRIFQWICRHNILRGIVNKL